MINAKKKVTIEEINEAIEKLQKQGITPNTQKIADIIGVTRQGVHLRLSKEGKLGEYRQIKNSKANVALQMLKDIDTKDIYIKDIYKLIEKKIDGNFMVYASFLRLVHKNNIPHKEVWIERFRKIDTAQYTSIELHEIIGKGMSLYSFRQALYKSKFPYKKTDRILPSHIKRLEHKELAKEIRYIDTSSMSIKEIWKLPIKGLGDFPSYQSIRHFLVSHNIPYKNTRS